MWAKHEENYDILKSKNEIIRIWNQNGSHLIILLLDLGMQSYPGKVDNVDFKINPPENDLKGNSS